MAEMPRFREMVRGVVHREGGPVVTARRGELAAAGLLSFARCPASTFSASVSRISGIPLRGLRLFARISPRSQESTTNQSWAMRCLPRRLPRLCVSLPHLRRI